MRATDLLDIVIQAPVEERWSRGSQRKLDAVNNHPSTIYRKKAFDEIMELVAGWMRTKLKGENIVGPIDRRGFHEVSTLAYQNLGADNGSGTVLGVILSPGRDASSYSAHVIGANRQTANMRFDDTETSQAIADGIIASAADVLKRAKKAAK